MSIDAEPESDYNEALQGEFDAMDRLKETPPYEAEQAETPERAPQVHHERVSVADIVQFAWGGVGQMLVSTGSDIPVGRVLQFQAPMAGDKIDELIRYTWLDKLLQPLARKTGNLEDIGALVMLPVLVHVYERNPEMGPMLEGLLKRAVEATLVDMVPVIKKQKADQKRQVAALKDVSDILDINVEKGQDPIMAVIASIFAVPEGYEPTEPGETVEA